MPRPLPQCPCEHRAGSREKIEAMRRRYARGEQLHHPDDERLLIDLPEISERTGRMRRGAQPH